MTDSDTNFTQRVLIVEDDIELASLMRDYLTKNGYQVKMVHDGFLAKQQILDSQPDLVILDVMLPSLSGMDLCKQVRDDFSGLIMMLTAIDEDIDQMLGLELGADDYIIKPVQPRLLLSRIRALLRRTQPQTVNNKRDSRPNAVFHFRNLIINEELRTVEIESQLMSLTTAEYDLLLLLAKNAGKPVSRDKIIKHLRGIEYDGLDRSIDRRVSRLRNKLSSHSSSSCSIATVRGKGYQLCVDPT